MPRPSSVNDGTQHPTGFWAEELVTPYTVFTDAGWDVDVATPGGRAPTVDKVSLGDGAGDADTLARVRAKLDELQPVLSQPLALEEVDDSAYDLVFYPGGHGPMEDLAVDEASGRILARRVQDNTPVALLCHAPAAVLAAVGFDFPLANGADSLSSGQRRRLLLARARKSGR